MAGVVFDDDIEAVRSDSQFVDRTVALFPEAVGDRS